MLRKTKYETAHSMDFALRTENFGLATVHSTDFALKTSHFGLANSSPACFRRLSPS